MDINDSSLLCILYSRLSPCGLKRHCLSYPMKAKLIPEQIFRTHRKVWPYSSFEESELNLYYYLIIALPHHTLYCIAYKRNQQWNVLCFGQTCISQLSEHHCLCYESRHVELRHPLPWESVNLASIDFKEESMRMTISNHMTLASARRCVQNDMERIHFEGKCENDIFINLSTILPSHINWSIMLATIYLSYKAIVLEHGQSTFNAKKCAM